MAAYLSPIAQIHPKLPTSIIASHAIQRWHGRLARESQHSATLNGTRFKLPERSDLLFSELITHPPPYSHPALSTAPEAAFESSDKQAPSRSIRQADVEKMNSPTAHP